MSSLRKQGIHTLLKGLETGDPASVEVINPHKYIQHNPQTHEGRDGLAKLFARLSKTSPRVNLVRTFSDGDYVFAHTEYDFATRRIGFEVFRFEGDQTVEHWDNIQPRLGPNASGHSMVDGPTEAIDQDKTEPNRELVRKCVAEVFIARQVDDLADYFDAGFVEHDPTGEDGLQALRNRLTSPDAFVYERTHRVLADGNFVLTVNEGKRDDAQAASYDLFRVADAKLVEHWNTVEHVAPKEEWKNDNGKF